MSASLRKPSAFENNFVHEQELMFKVQARRNKLVGLWAAAAMGRDNATDYAGEVAAAEMDGPDGVFSRLRKDFDAAGVTMLDDDIRDQMVSLLKDAAADMAAR